MARYINQNTFNAFTVVATGHLLFNPPGFLDMVFKIAGSLQEDYKDENLVKDIADAGREVALLIEKEFPPEELHTQFMQIQFCIKNYNPDGTKRPFRIFNGILFSSEKSPIQNLAKNCSADVAAYISLVSKGTIPKMPTGWRL
ncbi:MAG: hypothetical protein AB7V08_09550 [Elusimicrobiales bacterium]